MFPHVPGTGVLNITTSIPVTSRRAQHPSRGRELFRTVLECELSILLFLIQDMPSESVKISLGWPQVFLLGILPFLYVAVRRNTYRGQGYNYTTIPRFYSISEVKLPWVFFSGVIAICIIIIVL